MRRPIHPRRVATCNTSLLPGTNRLTQAVQTSPEAVARINQLYKDVLGREDGVDAQGLAGYQGRLASGAMTMDQVRGELAHSKEAQGKITAFYQSLFGPGFTPSATDLANCQAALAAGQSLKDQQAYLRQSFSGSTAENAAVDNVYLDKLGRHADPTGLAAQEAALTAGTPLSTIAASVATSQEAAVRIGDTYQQVLGRVADLNEIAAWQAQLDANATLNQIQAAIAVSPEATRGRLSEKYETGGRGIATVSSGVGDPGGVSYGSYQMSSQPNGGTVGRFVTDPSFPWASRFAGLTPGTAAFTAQWQALASEQPDALFAAQHDYIERTHYDPVVQTVLNKTGLDVNSRSLAVQDVVWSMAVQHGAAAELVADAIDIVGPQNGRSDLDYDSALIIQLYTTRGYYVAGQETLPPDMKTALMARYASEERDALNELPKPAALPGSGPQ